MTVTELRPPREPNPGHVALLLLRGVSAPECAEATWEDITAARSILEAATVIHALKASAADLVVDGMAATGSETFGDYAASLPPAEQNEVAALMWVMSQLANPLGDEA